MQSFANGPEFTRFPTTHDATMPDDTPPFPDGAPAADIPYLNLIDHCLNLTTDGFAVLDQTGAILVANTAFRTHIKRQRSPVFEMPDDFCRIQIGTKTVLHFRTGCTPPPDSGF